MRKIFALLALAALIATVGLPLQAAAPLHPAHTAAPSKPVTPAALHPVAPVVSPAPAICLNPKRDYDADYLSGRAVLIKATAGKKPRATLKADTNCIGIDRGVHIKLDAKGDCVAVGDALKLRRNGDYGWQTCQITQITPLAPSNTAQR